ncbi:hypothetical protein, partial [Ensifer sp. SSB1]|uniref:hypothetical protein n=1 Tax=Ensifer sp. SSB1 TaxID=2795385 RepID=UPI001A61200F
TRQYPNLLYAEAGKAEVLKESAIAIPSTPKAVGCSSRSRSTEVEMIPDHIAKAAWTLSALHLAHGQRDPTMMIAEAILLERRRCLEIAAQCCGENSDVVRAIAEG